MKVTPGTLKSASQKSNSSFVSVRRTQLSDRGGLPVEFNVRLSVLVVVLRLRLSAALLPHHGLLVVLSPVEAGALVDADSSHYLAVKTRRRPLRALGRDVYQAARPVRPSSYPLLPVLDARLCSVPFCRSWLFMMASCLCFSSVSLALISSSTHTSKWNKIKAIEHKKWPKCPHWRHNILFKAKSLQVLPRGVSSRTDLLSKLAP